MALPIKLFAFQYVKQQLYNGIGDDESLGLVGILVLGFFCLGFGLVCFQESP